MEYLSWIAFGIFVLNFQISESFPRGSRQSYGRCKPGYYATTPCTDSRNIACKRCPEGHFTSDWNTRVECFPCSQCGDGLFVLKQCSRTSDTFCAACSSTEARASAKYKEFCWGLDPDAAEMLSDEPEPGEDKDGNPIPVDLDTSYLLKGENDYAGEKDPEYSGEVVLKDMTDSKDGDSGITEVKDTQTQVDPQQDITKLQNITAESNDDSNIADLEDMVSTQIITDVDLSEGSGYVISEESSIDEELSDLLAHGGTVEPHEAVEDELIPVKPGLSTSSPYEVVDLDLGEDGSGLVVEDMTNVSVGEPVMATQRYNLSEETSEVLVEIDFSGEGEIVLNSNDSSAENTLVLAIPPDSTEEEDEAENLVGASLDEDQLAQGGMDGKTRTAVIVGVAAGAVIFFALGFFASRQCKKRHAFKNMKKVEEPQATQNGNTEAVEFRGGRTSGKYDPGSYDRVPPINGQTESVVLLSSKPLAHEPPEQHDRHVNGIEKMKYMDETTDDEAETASPRDRLIKDSDSPKEELESGDNSLSKDVMNKFDDKLAPIEEERQPMLANQGDSEHERS